LTDNWTARYQIARSFENRITLANMGSVVYESKCKCWAAGVELRQNRERGLGVSFVYRVMGLGNDLGGKVGDTFSGFGFLDGN
jgi:hypothetical protein